MFKEAMAELYIECPGHGFSPAELDSTVAVPLVILRKGIAIESIYIVALTLTFWIWSHSGRFPSMPPMKLISPWQKIMQSILPSKFLSIWCILDVIFIGSRKSHSKEYTLFSLEVAGTRQRL